MFEVLGFHQFQDAFLSTCFLARGLALFQQFVDDAGSLDCKKQDLKVALSAKDDSATGPLHHHQFEIPVECKDDVEMFSMPASPHNKDVMPKTREACDCSFCCFCHFQSKTGTEADRARTR